MSKLGFIAIACLCLSAAIHADEDRSRPRIQVEAINPWTHLDLVNDPDNFQFPRWCLDMSFLRVYENGQPASTPDHFRWRTEDFEAGEPVIVAGHPGSTQRLLTVAQLRRLRDVELPRRLLIGSELRGRMVEWGKRG